MKKTLLLLALAATLTSNAQLEVRSNGQVWAGNPKVGSSTVSTDTGASINVFGLESAHGGRLSFGDFGKVYIEEINGNSDQLSLRGAKGLRYTADTSNGLQSKIVFSYASSSDAFRFNCPVSASNIKVADVYFPVREA